MARAKADDIGIDEIVTEALERWPKAEEAEKDQRERILAAKKFRAGDQWDPQVKAARAGKNALQGVGAQPPRPCLTIDRISQPVRQISNKIQSANFALDVTPEGHGADDTTAEIYKGYLRRVMNQSRDESPIEWAADQAIEGGIGWFRLRTDYVDANPEPDAGVEAFDQEPCLERIANNLSVYDDPMANKPTRSDALYRFVTEDLDRGEFKRMYPWADVHSLDQFMSTGDPKYVGWVTQDVIRIAEYWRIVFTNEYWVALDDGTTQQIQHDEEKRFQAPKDIDGKVVDAWRILRRPTVEGYKITATQVLEELPWLGSHIPLIPVLGEELNVDGKTILRGLIAESMDAQRMVNWTYSEGVNILSNSSKVDYIIAAGQVDDFKEIWQTRNVYQHSYLPYKPIDVAGTPVPPPQRIQGEPANLQAAVQLMAISEEGIKFQTGVFDPSLGNTNPKERSGRAIQALQGQSDLGASNYGENVGRAIIYATEMILEILPKILRRGQVLQLIGQDDKAKKVIVGQPFITQKGEPIPLSPQEAAAQQQGVVQFFDHTKGRFAVAAKIGKADATKREEGAAALGDLIPHLPPEMAAVATPDYVEQLDFEGSHQIAEKLRHALPPQLQEQPEDDQIPPQVKSQLMAMKAQLDKAQQLIQTDGAKEQVKQQGMLQKAQIDADLEKSRQAFEREMKAMDNAAKIEVARISAKAQRTDTAMGMAEEAIALDHEAVQNQHDRVHDLVQGQQAHQQAMQQGAQGVAGDAALADQSQQHALEQGQQGHEQALQQNEQQAALAPEPATGGEQ